MIALVVDDDAANRDLLCRMLVRLGWLCDSVRDCDEACEACSRARYDIVLLDLYMPGRDGYESARAILEVYSAEERDRGSKAFKPVLVAVSGDRKSVV